MSVLNYSACRHRSFHPPSLPPSTLPSPLPFIHPLTRCAHNTRAHAVVFGHQRAHHMQRRHLRVVEGGREKGGRECEHWGRDKGRA